VHTLYVIPIYPRSPLSVSGQGVAKLLLEGDVLRACAAYRSALHSLHFLSLLTLLHLNTFVRHFIHVRCPDVYSFSEFCTSPEKDIFTLPEEKWHYLNMRSSDNFLLYLSGNRTLKQRAEKKVDF